MSERLVGCKVSHSLFQGYAVYSGHRADQHYCSPFRQKWRGKVYFEVLLDLSQVIVVWYFVGVLLSGLRPVLEMIRRHVR